MRVIGIDPGLRACGWGVIEAEGSRLRHVANGTIQTETGPLPGRLLLLHGALCRVLREHAPDAAAVEQTFVNRDGAGTLKLGQARGVAVLAVASAGLEVGEYMPNLVKKTVVGTGHAAKRQIDHMVRMQLPGCDPDSPDAADALAVALCHAFHLQTSNRLAAAIGAAR
jgi:crossover junction endodeoxyribonuclease RuvC